MSKQELVRTGWISFTGLRFARKFATREELIREIRNFFGRRVLNFGELKVEFRRTRRTWMWEFPPQGSYKRPGGEGHLIPGGLRVYTELHHNRRAFFLTLFHELDHVAWDLEGKSVNITLPYLQRPDEIRAFRVAEEEVRRLEGLQQVLPAEEKQPASF